MPHIDLPEGLPGILGPMHFRPQTAKPLNELADALLRGDSPLSRGDRELIAAYTSFLNSCQFCHTSHATFAALQLDEGWDVIDAVVADVDTAPVSDKVKALLKVAAAVQKGGLHVTDAHIQAARDAGADDVEIHDAVLIAAAFCMFNRYVDGLGTWAPTERADYEGTAQMIVSQGYVGSVPPAS